MALILAALTLLNTAWAGNGSSGVGTALIVHRYYAQESIDSVKNIDGYIVDLKSNEKIIKIDEMKKSEIDFTKLSKARYGQVQGYEYIPKFPSTKNYWVLCKSDENVCYKLSAISKTNRKIPAILGSLYEAL